MGLSRELAQVRAVLSLFSLALEPDLVLGQHPDQGKEIKYDFHNANQTPTPAYILKAMLSIAH